MDTISEFKVQYADTDAYGVVWHGTYLRWLEAGRVDWLFERGINIGELADKEGIVMPVVDVNIKYKFPAKLLDDVVVTTRVNKFTAASVTFEQIVTLKETGKVCVVAEIRATAIDENRKIVKDLEYRLGLQNREAALC